MTENIPKRASRIYVTEHRIPNLIDIFDYKKIQKTDEQTKKCMRSQLVAEFLRLA